MFVNKRPNKIYNVTLINQVTGVKNTIQVRGDEFIQEVAELEGIELPVSCRAGACVSCTGKLIEGEVDQDQIFLKRKEEEAGFILLCKSYPMSDCVILTHQEEALLNL
ncbi:MAG: 2Fe-2S iron-sulfur cluster binding domain-containing protein [Gomphosphaeria aponina SAG 52.96 = DSM 107014]|uniref:2Fe-2S iron-sulfur cluster binding domain-containing protein n=1 Tax=Gomphosphaeria aponina SAG 52.96 = DSM 107014 TaxID=1521640 RepID=A0A941GV73_9CHRO|nr:2Fe-2S iron-sulfur cluster binding domain-containing protein [Gomphosphaeria aponina SAG 52.96 = DSM 107014]